MYGGYFSKYIDGSINCPLENLHPWSSGTYFALFCFIKIFDLSLTILTPENR